MNDTYQGLKIIYMGKYPAVHMPKHPKANSEGLVYIHHLIAEKILGRNLKNEECVHHIDGDKNNYNENNLIIFATIGEHQRYHNAIRFGLDYCLFKKNEVYFCIVGDFYLKNIFNIYNSMIKGNSQIRSKCPICGNLKTKNSKICINCYKIEKSSRIPTKENLEKLLFSLKNFKQIGKIYGVSDNAIRKWCKKYELPYKTKDIKI